MPVSFSSHPRVRFMLGRRPYVDADWLLGPKNAASGLPAARGRRKDGVPLMSCSLIAIPVIAAAVWHFSVPGLIGTANSPASVPDSRVATERSSTGDIESRAQAFSERALASSFAPNAAAASIDADAMTKVDTVAGEPYRQIDRPQPPRLPSRPQLAMAAMPLPAAPEHWRISSQPALPMDVLAPAPEEVTPPPLRIQPAIRTIALQPNLESSSEPAEQGPPPMPAITDRELASASAAMPAQRHSPTRDIQALSNRELLRLLSSRDLVDSAAAVVELQRRGLDEHQLSVAVTLCRGEQRERLAAIGTLIDGTFADPLAWLHWLSEDTDAQIRLAAARSLAAIDHPTAINYLREMLHNESLLSNRRVIQMLLDQHPKSSR